MSNKKLSIIIISIVLCLSVIIFGVAGFGIHSIINDINEIKEQNKIENSELVMDIQTHPYEEDHSLDNNDNNVDICYYSLTTDGKVTEAEAFTPDDIDIYNVNYSKYSHHITFKNSSFRCMHDITLTDENGNNIEITPVITDIINQIKDIDHDTFKMKIFKLDDEYFVYAELNVNLWYPCTLYYYNQEASKLIKLYEFDDEEITGIKIHSLDPLKSTYY